MTTNTSSATTHSSIHPWRKVAHRKEWVCWACTRERHASQSASPLRTSALDLVGMVPEWKRVLYNSRICKKIVNWSTNNQTIDIIPYTRVTSHALPITNTYHPPPIQKVLNSCCLSYPFSLFHCHWFLSPHFAPKIYKWRILYRCEKESAAAEKQHNVSMMALQCVICSEAR